MTVILLPAHHGSAKWAFLQPLISPLLLLPTALFHKTMEITKVAKKGKGSATLYPEAARRRCSELKHYRVDFNQHMKPWTHVLTLHEG